MADPLPKTGRWVLTQEAFDALLLWLHPDREQAGKIFEQIRARLMTFFECQGCPFFEDYADEAMQRVMRRLSEGEKVRHSDPYAYFHGVARNILKEYWKGPERKWERLDALRSSDTPAADPSLLARRQAEQANLERELRCLELCLNRLSSPSREVFLEYHRWERSARIENRSLLADRMGIPLNALRIRVHRIRGTLEECLNECVEKSGRD